MVGSCDLLVVYGLLVCAFVIWVLVGWVVCSGFGFWFMYSGFSFLWVCSCWLQFGWVCWCSTRGEFVVLVSVVFVISGCLCLGVVVLIIG